MVLCIVGADLSSPQIPGAFSFEDDDFFVLGVPSDHGTGALGSPALAAAAPTAPLLAPHPSALDLPRAARVSVVVAPELRRGIRPLRLPIDRLTASRSPEVEDH